MNFKSDRLVNSGISTRCAISGGNRPAGFVAQRALLPSGLCRPAGFVAQQALSSQRRLGSSVQLN